MEEKRVLLRYQIQQFVQIDFNKEEFLPAEGLNISARGMLCRLPSPQQPGQRVFVMLNLGTPLKPEILSLDAVIVWAKEEGRCIDDVCPWLAGLEFVDVPSSSQAQLEAFLALAPVDGN
ncbi:MAG: PilZ domain-containing protein [Spirochaetales bacterium]|nr:PilZ domain-containing protein [Spirochaetales bacterium]